MKPSEVSTEWLEARCVDRDGCLIWQGVCAKGHPRHRFRDGDFDGCVHMRPLVFALYRQPLQKGQRVTMTCNDSRCLNHKHMKIITQAEVLARTMQDAGIKAKRQATVTKLLRERRGKLTMEKARYVRSSGKTLEAMAKELGVSIALISKVRLGQSWAESGASPFAGLGART